MSNYYRLIGVIEHTLAFSHPIDAEILHLWGSTMDVFALRENLVRDYSEYASGFIRIHDDRISQQVRSSFEEGIYWPDPLVQFNPSFEQGGTVGELVQNGLLHPECNRIFLRNKEDGGQQLRFHRHQREAIEIAREGHNFILTTGTGSGKSLAYIVPIVDHVLRRGSGRGIQAIIVYPMNALANSQMGELTKFLVEGYPEGKPPVTFARYTGQESEEDRQRIIAHPPDILLTNYVMLELIMTRPRERQLFERAKGLRFLVLDELHTYRGRQGADVALLVRRVRNRLETADQPIQFVGTSATLASEGTYSDQRRQIAGVGTQLFGVTVEPSHVVGETLRRTTPEHNHDSDFRVRVLKAVAQGDSLQVPTRYDDFVAHPISQWIEDAIGLREQDGRLVRQRPRRIGSEDGVAKQLADDTGLDQDHCASVIQRWLLAGYGCERNPETGSMPFAFRLHQFISPGDTAYATIEDESSRYISLTGQRFVPGSREQLLIPLCFCRECGQEYYTVRLVSADDEPYCVAPREFGDRMASDDGEVGYLYIGSHRPWPSDTAEMLEADYLPDDWIEERNGIRRVKRHRRAKLPRHVQLNGLGEQAEDGLACVFVPEPFLFCLNCGVSYGPRQGDFGKLVVHQEGT